MKLILLLVIVLTIGVVQGKSEDCGECNRFKCEPLEYCVSGIVKDACNCCEVCARRLGDTCDIEIDGLKATTKHGACGEFLTCSETEDSEVGTCVCSETGPVCGTDEVTYDNLCDLLEKAENSIDLTVFERDACRKGPVIKSPPKDSKRPLNSLLLLDCEAYGVPVPTITWELNRPDGSTVKLPGDNPLVAVQLRGGPEKQMATGWVQIMKVSSDNVGIYTCIATNAEGETRASANVTYRKGKPKKKKKN